MMIKSLFHRLPVNTLGRDFVVGDVHGQIEMLDRLLRAVRFNADKDRLIALGDLIDRGSGSQALLERVRDEPWFYSVRGNHEAMMQWAAKDRYGAMIWSRNGNEWSHALSEPVFQDLATIIEGMPLAIELPLPNGWVIGLVHAEVKPGHAWSELRDLTLEPSDIWDDAATTLAASALWGRRRIHAVTRMIRDPFAMQTDAGTRARCREALVPVAGIAQVISGHTILHSPRPLAVRNLLFIDTGAFEDEGLLTLVEPAGQHYWQVARQSTGRLRVLTRTRTRVSRRTRVPLAFRVPKTEAPPS